jgi:hypothetical protein
MSILTPDRAQQFSYGRQVTITGTLKLNFLHRVMGGLLPLLGTLKILFAFFCQRLVSGNFFLPYLALLSARVHGALSVSIEANTLIRL